MMMTKWTVLALGAAVMVIGGAAVFRTAADSPIEGRSGRAELRFLEGMIDHHQMAVDAATECLARAATEDVRALCQNIISAQRAEIETMQGWIADWYQTSYSPVSMQMPEAAESAQMSHDMAGHDMDMPSDPAMTMGMMAGLSRLDGRDYDIAWVEAMIDHHDDALHMANRILERAEHPELIELAHAIVTDQTAEIQHMEALLVQLAQ